MATYLIGDIQGCYDPLQRLMAKINFDPACDSLWCPGDLVNRGGDSLEVLRLLESLGDNFVMTLGNHDLYLLSQNYRYPDGHSPNSEINAILQAPDRLNLLDWIQRQPLAYWSDEHQVLMVHAGVVPQWTLEQTLSCAAEVEQVLQSKKCRKFFKKMRKNGPRRWHDKRSGWRRRQLISNILTRIRYCDGNGKILMSASGAPGSEPQPYRPWFKHKHRQTRNITIAFGHWAALGLHLKKRLLGVDSACVWGGRLSAVRLEDRRVIQVPGLFR
jgi:bis(5'-nucleosyl)-tetraphosphatase (symmetrical)